MWAASLAFFSLILYIPLRTFIDSTRHSGGVLMGIVLLIALTVGVALERLLLRSRLWEERTSLLYEKTRLAFLRWGRRRH